MFIVQTTKVQAEWVRRWATGRLLPTTTALLMKNDNLHFFSSNRNFFVKFSSAATSFLTQMLNVFSSKLFITRKYAKNERVLAIKLILSRL